jgi:hypothetical protein
MLDLFHKPIFGLMIFSIVFAAGLGVGSLWARGRVEVGFTDYLISIKSNVVPLGNEKFIVVAKGAEKFQYQLKDKVIELDLSKKSNSLHVVDLSDDKPAMIELGEKFDFEKVFFVFATSDRLYFFDRAGVSGGFVDRR